MKLVAFSFFALHCAYHIELTFFEKAISAVDVCERGLVNTFLLSGARSPQSSLLRAVGCLKPSPAHLPAGAGLPLQRPKNSAFGCLLDFSLRAFLRKIFGAIESQVSSFSTQVG